MKSTTLQQKMQILILVLLALGLSACTPSQDSGAATTLSSSAVVLPAPITNQSNSNALVQCTSTVAPSSDYQINLAAYTQNGAVRSDLMYVRFNQLPSTFMTDGSFIELYRWMGTGASTSYVDPTPLALTFIDPNSGAVYATNLTYVRWADVASAASSLGYTDANSFFSHILIVANLRDTTGIYEAMLSIHYNSSSVEVDRANTLLPVFDADPSLYAVKSDGTARNTNLKLLHPFAAQLGLSQTQYQSMANNLCAPFTN